MGNMMYPEFLLENGINSKRLQLSAERVTCNCLGGSDLEMGWSNSDMRGRPSRAAIPELRWLGLLIRMLPEHHLVDPSGSRPQGRPRTRRRNYTSQLA